MRRWLCVLQIGVLTSVLATGVASASLQGANSAFAPPAVDLTATLFTRLFGESTDREASFNAAAGDPMAETPLRDLAFRVNPVAQTTVVETVASQLPVPNLDLSDPSFAPPSQPRASIADLSAKLRVPAVEYYESADPVPTDAPATHRFDLDGLQVRSAQVSDFAPGPQQPAESQTPQGANLSIPLQIGKVRFAPHAEAAQAQNLQTNFATGALGAGATLNVRAGSRSLGVDLSSALEHSTLTAPEFSPVGAPPALGLAGNNLPVFVPAYADVSTHTLSTGLTVPVTRALTANVNFNSQHLLGGYAPGVAALDANNTIYGAQLTYNLPRTSSAISFSASQYHFQDNLVPANALTQTTANVNFTIKF
ncbi:MAG: hypothetical protein WA629_12745 [Candidatus Aquilonibacter sp.]